MSTSDESPAEDPAREVEDSRGHDAPPEDIRGNDVSREDIRGTSWPGGPRGGGAPATFQQIRQAGIVIRNVDGVNVPEGWRKHGVDVFYREHHILVRDEYVRRVLDLLGPVEPAEGGGEPDGDREAERAEAARPRPDRRVVGVVAGVNLVRISQTVIEALYQVAEAFGVGVAAPDHLLSIAPGGTCPATEPEVVPAWADPDPGPAADHAAGEGVRVVVVDTGFDTGYDPTVSAAATHTWMDGVTGDPDKAIGSDGTLGHYAGHGTFIAGIIRCVAPAAEVVVKNLFDNVGTTFESKFVKELEQVLATEHPDIISMSAGSSTLPGVGMLGLEQFFETHLRPHKGVVLVTAAGNNHVRRPY